MIQVDEKLAADMIVETDVYNTAPEFRPGYRAKIQDAIVAWLERVRSESIYAKKMDDHDFMALGDVIRKLREGAAEFRARRPDAKAPRRRKSGG